MQLYVKSNCMWWTGNYHKQFIDNLQVTCAVIIELLIQKPDTWSVLVNILPTVSSYWGFCSWSEKPNLNSDVNQKTTYRQTHWKCASRSKLWIYFWFSLFKKKKQKGQFTHIPETENFNNRLLICHQLELMTWRSRFKLDLLKCWAPPVPPATSPKCIYLFKSIPLLLFMVFIWKVYSKTLLNSVRFVCECMNVESWATFNKILKRKCSPCMRSRGVYWVFVDFKMIFF